MQKNTQCAQAARLIENADGLLIAAGAGMGVDSGLPDFRGTEGFWRAYPALGKAQLRFEAIADPHAFHTDPRLAWGFYGHRLNSYRAVTPHAGFYILQKMAENMPHGMFVFTSNVDGQFQKSGVDEKRVVECHGSIHHLQCLENCDAELWPADDFWPDVDDENCRLRSPLPECPVCHALARPNILMFNDWNWLDARTHAQLLHFRRWRQAVKRLVVIEIGAGTAIPTVRDFSEEQACPLIRINTRASQVHRPGDVGLAMGGLAGLQAIAAAFA
ncbi:MAG: NAD-dependent deacetylase [Zoogloeaceae bacterium]|jgi:NAD-dependent SIR2 family protein deacetylase|nr:NAD-dependent deacetylase [Zoogloeaceae bacterium]